MTLRRWQKGLDPREEEMQIGPQERATRAELAEMGWDQDTPGALSTVAQQAIAVSEAIDRSVSARDIAACTNELSRRMAEARAVGKGRKLSVVEQAQARSRGRGPGASGPRRSAG